MPVYETINAEIKRPHLTARDLRLGFELCDEFCSAVWQALDAPVQVALACQRQETPRALHERAVLEITDGLKKQLEGLVINAAFAEAKRIGVELPNELTDQNNIERLIAGCVEHDHLAVARFYKAYHPNNLG